MEDEKTIGNIEVKEELKANIRKNLKGSSDKQKFESLMSVFSPMMLMANTELRQSVVKYKTPAKSKEVLKRRAKNKRASKQRVKNHA